MSRERTHKRGLERESRKTEREKSFVRERVRERKREREYRARKENERAHAFFKRENWRETGDGTEHEQVTVLRVQLTFTCSYVNPIDFDMHEQWPIIAVGYQILALLPLFSH